MKTLFLFAVLATYNFAFSQGEGKMTKYDMSHYDCDIDEITVKWRFSLLMGEPVINGTFEWYAANGTSPNCVNYNDFIILKCQSKASSSSYAWVAISPDVKASGKGFGFNVSGSPSWDDVFCSFGPDGEKTQCWSAEDAKRFWKSGFTIVDFKVKGEE